MTRNMGRKSRNTPSRKPLIQKIIKNEPDTGESSEIDIKNMAYKVAETPVFIKTEDPSEEAYPETEFYEVAMLNVDNLIKEECDEDEHNPEEEEEISYRLPGPPKLCSKCWEAFPIEKFSNHVCNNQTQEEDEISYHLAGPPKVCSKCLEGFPIDEFPTHECKDINADRFSCRICPRKFRYKSLLIIHLKSHLRLQKGETIPELEPPKPEKKAPTAKTNFVFNYSPTPRWKLSRRRAGMMHREMRIQQQRMCNYCPIAFSNESHLEKHLKDHHSEIINSNEVITPDAVSDGSELICVKLEKEEPT
ncbi:histone-lysine N-methyltransferase PRDM9 [Drosophila eugracilis]|uniref:histone-lysine N-methyltransferase PRDM9 n=1 Tax=Drosophila eugracilis TaxID=29029 RepID=UPI0007E7A83D|nr:histone-lysine N-methyltransferase PRDM9 [Drosophila eugracilis]